MEKMLESLTCSWIWIYRQLCSGLFDDILQEFCYGNRWLLALSQAAML